MAIIGIWLFFLIVLPAMEAKELIVFSAFMHSKRSHVTLGWLTRYHSTATLTAQKS